MNNYPAWWDQSITVYNKYEHPQTHVITWYSHKLTGCFWKYTENQITLGETAIESAITLCRVPVNPLFKERYAWEQLMAPERLQFFTFGPGDIVIKGDVSDIVDEYVSGHRSSDLLTKYKKLQGCMVVQQCAVNVGSGRGNEHYLVKGV